MKAIIASLFFLAFGANAAPVQPLQSSQVHPVARFELDGVPISQVVRLIYAEAIKTPYVLDAEVLADMRPISFRYETSRGDVHPFLIKLLDSMGYIVEARDGVDFVRHKPADDSKDGDKETFVYRPKYRDASYLIDLLSPLFKGGFASKRAVQAPAGDKVPAQGVPPNSALAQIDRQVDILVFSGTPNDVAALKKLLPQVDIRTGEVMVRGVVYEVQTTKNDGSAFQLAASILGGKLGVSFGPASPLDSSVKFSSGSISAVYSALANDSRFKIVSSPSARVRSGSKVRFVVGEDVPVLGSLSYPQGSGQAVQSVQYQSSGAIFEVTANIRDATIDLDLSQQLSNFVNTTTGVNSSPTLTKRELTTSISAADGDLIAVGGLTEDQDTTTHSGLSFLPTFLHSNSVDASRTEVLLFLQVTRL